MQQSMNFARINWRVLPVRKKMLTLPAYGNIRSGDSNANVIHWPARQPSHNRNRGASTMKYTHMGLWLICSILPVTAATAQDNACTDPCLKAAIATFYMRSPFLNPFQIDVTVKNSIATLEGTVSDEGERALAEELAIGLEGITRVVNRIRVQPSASAEHPAGIPVDCLTNDTALADRVKTQLYWNRATHGMTIDVSTHNGIVTLTGQAIDQHQAELARLIAINTCGVKQVDSRLQVLAEQ
jgi:osmotically-inducible protein OsmY